MPRPGIRLKLVLAMMAVVVLATGASLVVAQRRVREAYQRLADQQFEAQFNRFAELQAARLGAVGERCRSAVRTSVRLRAAAEETDAELLYLTGADELRVLTGDSPQNPRPAFFLFFDARGEVIPPPDPGSAAAQRVATWSRDGRRLPVVPTLRGASEQWIGIAALRDPDGRLQPMEVVITRIPGPDESAALGALLLAFPAVLPGDPDPATASGTRARPAASAEADLRFGIWSGGAWFTRASRLDAEHRRALQEALDGRIERSAETSGEFEIFLEGQPHRVAYRAMTATSQGAETGEVAFQVGVHSLAEARHQQALLRRQILQLGAVSLGGALVLSLALAHGLSVPIRELQRGTAEVLRGNLQIQVPVRSRDELGDLAVAFNEMTAGLELKERYRTVLNSVADERVARQLLEGGLTLGGEERPVTMLFCDIRGFTAHTENMAPAEVIEFLNEHMTALTRVVKAHHGVLDKFVGDLLMALFGAPVSRGQDALDGARCALEILSVRNGLNTVSRHRLQVGIGVATGEVVAGCMGSLDRLNYTVIGERVNLASRLCSLAKPGQVVVDEATRLALGDLADVRPLAPVKLKGFSGEVQAFELVGLREAVQSAPDSR
ncbi:MAG: HAMP domain-containing protein [Verrucomicrobia bacterium]|nr:HAMP domain-containing protein [Verrucomicrobiota bacterium]